VDEPVAQGTPGTDPLAARNVAVPVEHPVRVKRARDCCASCLASVPLARGLTGASAAAVVVVAAVIGTAVADVDAGANLDPRLVCDAVCQAVMP
jgi:homoserine kinase